LRFLLSVASSSLLDEAALADFDDDLDAIADLEEVAMPIFVFGFVFMCSLFDLSMLSLSLSLSLSTCNTTFLLGAAVQNSKFAVNT
jgi:hypothetical protein